MIESDQTINELSDTGSLTVEELYASLRVHEELILTIPADSVNTLKSRLSQYKTRNAPDEDKDSRLSYRVVKESISPISGKNPSGTVDLHIILKRGDTFPVYNIRKPEEL